MSTDSNLKLMKPEQTDLPSLSEVNICWNDGDPSDGCKPFDLAVLRRGNGDDDPAWERCARVGDKYDLSNGGCESVSRKLDRVGLVAWMYQIAFAIAEDGVPLDLIDSEFRKIREWHMQVLLDPPV